MATLLAAEERTKKLTALTRSLVAESTTSKLRRSHFDELAERDEVIYNLQCELEKAKRRATGPTPIPMGDESAPARAAGVLLGGNGTAPTSGLINRPDPFDEFARGKGTSRKGACEPFSLMHGPPRGS